ncbi:MAG: 4Fe-4S dicluster domain-containing protein [Planctomycetota bacterium]|jgi:molybdopterin-containing oxidoreductase family iron-sulfur binding subunit
MGLPPLQPGPVHAGDGTGDLPPWERKAAPAPGAVSRRSFLRSSAAAAGGLAALAAAVSPLADLIGSDDAYFANFFQKHYKEMSAEEIERVLQRIKADVERRYGVTPDIRDVKPMDGVEFVYALNVSRCNGNRRCVHACVAENNQSRSPELQYIRVIEMPRGTMDLEQGNHHYGGAVPDRKHYYLPVQCHQCANPPCTKVCPVEATWQEPDGITVIDYDWCIGCRYCEAACPYWARRFNFTDPEIPEGRLNPDMSYLSNRPRERGVMEKCTFCLHRTREGRLPACLEACPTGARKFGNVLDPDSEVAQILKAKRVFVLKEEVGTLPRFFYYFDERHSRSAEPGPDLTEGAGMREDGEAG